MADPTITAQTAALVLAAGLSRRMGRNKMLLPFGGRPMIARVIEGLRAAEKLSSITVVTGHESQEILAAAGEYTDVAFVHNADYIEGGMLSSVQAGVRALPKACDAFFLVLGDQPMVLPETLNALRKAILSGDASIAVPTYSGKRGHPALIARRFANEILMLGANDTLKTLMLRHAEETYHVAVDDPATVHDIDTPEDYEAALLRWRQVGRQIAEPG